MEHIKDGQIHPSNNLMELWCGFKYDPCHVISTNRYNIACFSAAVMPFCSTPRNRRSALPVRNDNPPSQAREGAKTPSTSTTSGKSCSSIASLDAVHGRGRAPGRSESPPNAHLALRVVAPTTQHLWLSSPSSHFSKRPQTTRHLALQASLVSRLTRLARGLISRVNPCGGVRSLMRVWASSSYASTTGQIARHRVSATFSFEELRVRLLRASVSFFSICSTACIVAKASRKATLARPAPMAPANRWSPRHHKASM